MFQGCRFLLGDCRRGHAFPGSVILAGHPLNEQSNDQAPGDRVSNCEWHPKPDVYPLGG